MTYSSKACLAAAMVVASLSLIQACNEARGTAPGARPTPSSLSKVQGDSQVAVVDSPVRVPPDVVVLDSAQNPIAGVVVTFTVAGGGGRVSGAIDTTDATGATHVGSWTLGPALGENRLAAAAGALEVLFTATGIAAPAAPLPSSLSKVQGDSQVAVVDSPVRVPPDVVVLDSARRPIAGVVVTFAVAGGGGRVSGAIDTTDATGAAHVGSWTLGPALGENRLTAAVGALEVLFTATGVAGPATTLVKLQGDQVTGVVGSAVVPPPALRVNDAFGNPVAGVTVSFTVVAGGGSITGSTATSGPDGVAALGGWTLGTKAGTNTVRAAAGQLPTASFSANAVAGPADSVAIVAGNGQTGSIGAPVAVSPEVRVADAYGNAVPGALVTFQVTSGGGSVVAATQRSDAGGDATVGSWVLGSSPGTNTLSATALGLPPVSFTATGVDYCAGSTPYTIGGTVNGNLSATSCLSAYGSYMNTYATSEPVQQRVSFTLSSSAFYTALSLLDSTGVPIARNADDCADPDLGCDPPVYSSTGFTVLLGKGAFIVGASSSYSSEIGAYSLSSVASADESVTGCNWSVYVSPGITTSQQLDTTDCRTAFRGSSYYSQQFVIYLVTGRTYTITMTSSDFDAYLELDGLYGGGLVASNDDYGGTTNSQISYTPTWSGEYLISAETYLGDKTGAYTLSVSETASAGSAVARCCSDALTAAPSGSLGPAVRLPSGVVARIANEMASLRGTAGRRGATDAAGSGQPRARRTAPGMSRGAPPLVFHPRPPKGAR